MNTGPQRANIQSRLSWLALGLLPMVATMRSVINIINQSMNPSTAVTIYNPNDFAAGYSEWQILSVNASLSAYAIVNAYRDSAPIRNIEQGLLNRANAAP